MGHRGHGREELRTLKVVTVTSGLPFSHAVQAMQIKRQVREGSAGRWRSVTVYAITDLAAWQAPPADLAAWIRGHWSIENRLHYVRDVTYAEDHSQVRTDNAPRTMASLRNLALRALRLTGVGNIAQAIRHISRDATRTLTLTVLDLAAIEKPDKYPLRRSPGATAPLSDENSHTLNTPLRH